MELFNSIGTCGIGSSCSALRCSANGNQEAPPPKPQVPALSSCNVMKIWGQITGSYTLRYGVLFVYFRSNLS